MGIFEFIKKAGRRDTGTNAQTVEHTFKLTLKPENVRQVDEAGVKALDQALTRVGSGELLHLFDPRRLMNFEGGGPSTWSIAFVRVDGDLLLVTYGNSDRIEPSSVGRTFELSIRVPEEAGTEWPAALLSALARYVRTNGRELRVGDFLPLPTPITRVATGAEERGIPTTGMDTVLLVQDPLLPTVATPRGPIEVRRVVGLFPDERELMSLWTVAGLIKEMEKKAPRLETDVARQSFTTDAGFVQAMRAGSQREGSQFGFIAVPGVTWEMRDGSCAVRFPGGAEALRIHAMLKARLPFGKNLLVHEVDPQKRLAVAFQPAQQFGITLEGEVAVVDIPPGAPLVDLFARPSGPVIAFKARPRPSAQPPAVSSSRSGKSSSLTLEQLRMCWPELAHFVSGEGVPPPLRYSLVAAFQGNGAPFAVYEIDDVGEGFSSTTHLCTFETRPVLVEISPELSWSRELAITAAKALAEGRLASQGHGTGERFVREEDLDALF